jgi:hypothetical protein
VKTIKIDKPVVKIVKNASPVPQSGTQINWDDPGYTWEYADLNWDILYPTSGVHLRDDTSKLKIIQNEDVSLEKITTTSPSLASSRTDKPIVGNVPQSKTSVTSIKGAGAATNGTLFQWDNPIFYWDMANLNWDEWYPSNETHILGDRGGLSNLTTGKIAVNEISSDRANVINLSGSGDKILSPHKIYDSHTLYDKHQLYYILYTNDKPKIKEITERKGNLVHIIYN